MTSVKRVWVVGLVAVTVHVPVELLGQREREMHVFDSPVARRLVVWDAAH